MDGQSPHAANDADEQTALLPNLDGPDRTSLRPHGNRVLRGPFSHLLFLAILAFLIEAGSVLESMPLYKVFEDAICRQVVARTDESISCGEDARVQAELAVLGGYRYTCSLIPGLIMAIPYGVMAERYGHRSVLTLSALGSFIEAALTLSFCRWPRYFDLRIVSVLPLLTFIGGGSSVQGATIFACLSELSTDTSRATVFAYFGGIDLAARLVLSILAASMIDRDVWVPIYIGLGSSAASAIWSMCLPRASFGRPSRQPDNSMLDGGASREEESDQHQSPPHRPLLGKVREGVKKTYNSLTFVFNRANWSVFTLMIPLLLTSIAWRSLQLLAQLARNRFGWSWSDASYLVPLETTICIAVMILLLPWASFVMSDRLSMPAVSRDMILARASCFLVASGALVVGISRSPAVMITGLCVLYLGTGYNVILRSLLASVSEGHTPILFNCVALLESAGSLISGPVMAQSYKAGLSLGGSWVGMPFFIAAGLSTAASLTLSAAKPLACKSI